MTDISHLPENERMHYILCDCGNYIDMRELDQVFDHQHYDKLPVAEWNYAVRKGIPFAFYKNKTSRALN